jgi:ABC-type bacteriocin/lantibiotic exporter with double-glycine peptidase domain
MSLRYCSAIAIVLIGGVLSFNAVVATAEEVAGPRLEDLLSSYHQTSICGPISLWVICRYHESSASLEEVEELCQFDGQAVSIEALCTAAQRKGLKPNAMNSSISHLRTIGGPAIIDYPAGHFCVFLGWKDGQVHLYDLPDGVRIVSVDTLQRSWGKHIILFRPLAVTGLDQR